jgi:hypothetical protein
MNDEKAQATETPDSAASALSAGLGFDVALNVRHPDCHKAADAFWKYWEENGETHKHGYYESTWGAINAALRVVGVRPHDWSGVKPKPEFSGWRHYRQSAGTTGYATTAKESR